MLFYIGCEKKYKPIIIKDNTLSHPIKCLKLNPSKIDKEFISTLNKLYIFQDSCPYVLSVSYKKDIICNSIYNVQARSFGDFPKSFLRFEVKKGLDIKYSYYLDLSSNVDSKNIKESFKAVLNNLK